MTPKYKYSRTYDTIRYIKTRETRYKAFLAPPEERLFLSAKFYTNHTKMRNNPNNTPTPADQEGWERFREASQPAFETPNRPSAYDNTARHTAKSESPQDYREKLEQELQSPGSSEI